MVMQGLAAMPMLSQAAIAADLAPFWELLKGAMLFVTTGCVAFIAKTMWTVREMVFDHERAIYGRDGVNGLKRGQANHEKRIGLIEDRNIAIDAVAAAERAQYTGEERRHDPVRRLVEMIRTELQEERMP